MLLCFSLLILTHFWPLLRAQLALATLCPPVTDPQILERWGCADEVQLGQIYERRIVVSNSCVTCNSLREFHTLDWFLV